MADKGVLYMHEYKVAWLDHFGNRHESIAHGDNPHDAELEVWEKNQECLGIICTYQLDGLKKTA